MDKTTCGRGCESALKLIDVTRCWIVIHKFFSNNVSVLRNAINAVILTLAISVPAIAQLMPVTDKLIEIKGIRIGMTKAEVKAIIPKFKDFTVASVPEKYGTPTLEYRDGKLADFSFFFVASSFDDVKAAIQDKYPEMACISSRVGNALGASFEQLRCVIQNAESILVLSRFVSDIHTSVLSMTSMQLAEEMNDEAKRKRKDI